MSETIHHIYTSQNIKGLTLEEVLESLDVDEYGTGTKHRLYNSENVYVEFVKKSDQNKLEITNHTPLLDGRLGSAIDQTILWCDENSFPISMCEDLEETEDGGIVIPRPICRLIEKVEELQGAVEKLREKGE
jgi:hypothetical protein